MFDWVSEFLVFFSASLVSTIETTKSETHSMTPNSKKLEEDYAPTLFL
jgi:hypothetical protein